MELLIYIIIIIFVLIWSISNNKKKDSYPFTSDDDLNRQLDELLKPRSTPFEPDSISEPRSSPVPSKPFVFIHPNDKRTYLASPEWNVRRKATLKRDHYACVSCGTSGVPLQVHHTHYRTFGQEDISCLRSLCGSCHENLHKVLGYDHSDDFPVI